MTFKKNKKETIENKKWKKFCREHITLIQDTGIPQSYLDSLDLFCDFLMHGYIDHHDVIENFTTDNMDSNQSENFKKLVWYYFESGFDNPGIVVFDFEYTKKLEKRFPKQFVYK